MEMRQGGLSDDEINARSRMLQQDVLQTTAQGLKEHFVLQKIAEVEKIEVSDNEIESEIEALAERENQSPRRLRAQLERDDLLENLAILIIERKVMDFILDTAEYEDVQLEPEKGVAPVEAQAVAGEMRDPTAAPPADEEKAAEDAPSA
jgi:trigger factor